MIKKIGLLALALVIIVGAGYFMSTYSNSHEIISSTTIDDLEADLADLDTQIAAGTLSPVEADAARTRIIAKLDAVNANVIASNSKELTAAQRAQLADGLTRLKQVLVKYNNTLVAVDTIVAKDGKKGGGSRTLSSHFLGTLQSSEQKLYEGDAEYQPDMDLKDELETIDIATPDVLEDISFEADADEAVVEEDPTTDEEVSDEDITTEAEVETETTAAAGDENTQ